MIITIDGPAGAGKSTISQEFAKLINYDVLDTGAMYRCVAYLKKETGLSLNDVQFQQDILNMKLVFRNNEVWLNDKNVTKEIRTSEIDILTSIDVSPHIFVRSQMCNLQRKIAKDKNMVVEGRDMGSNVFPNSPLKFYLNADTAIRAHRRHNQLLEKNIHKDLKELEQEIIQRDFEDFTRTYSPLCIPEGAYIIDTSELSLDKVLTKMLEIFQRIV
ncbi:MAG: (d)CMP kinase [Spirochaetota bacterium]|nr:(d)CMP kinase [Spirochaetota bacterium]